MDFKVKNWTLIGQFRNEAQLRTFLSSRPKIVWKNKYEKKCTSCKKTKKAHNVILKHGYSNDRRSNIDLENTNSYKLKYCNTARSLMFLYEIKKVVPQETSLQSAPILKCDHNDEPSVSFSVKPLYMNKGDFFLDKSLKNDTYTIKSKLQGNKLIYMACDNVNNVNKVVEIVPLANINFSIDSINKLEKLRHINCEHLVKHFDRFADDHYVYIVREFHMGISLRDIMDDFVARNLAFEDVQVLEWTIQMLDGLKCLHDLKITHGDLAPRNVLIMGDFTLKLDGFSGSLLNENYVIKNFVNSIEYMSPELLDKHEPSPKSDIWSLACIVYELTFLQKAFPSVVAARTVHSLKFNVPSDKFIVPIIKKMLNTPNERPDSFTLYYELANIRNRISSSC